MYLVIQGKKGTEWAVSIKQNPSVLTLLAYMAVLLNATVFADDFLITHALPYPTYPVQSDCPAREVEPTRNSV